MYFIFRLERTSSPPPLSTSPSPPNLLPLSPFSPYFPLPLLSFTLLPSPLLLSPLSLVLSPEPYACGTNWESARLSRACAILPNISQFRCVVILRKSSDFFQHKRSPFSPFITLFFYCCFSPHFKQGRSWREVRRPRLTFLMKNATEDA